MSEICSKRNLASKSEWHFSTIRCLNVVCGDYGYHWGGEREAVERLEGREFKSRRCRKWWAVIKFVNIYLTRVMFTMRTYSLFRFALQHWFKPSASRPIIIMIPVLNPMYMFSCSHFMFCSTVPVLSCVTSCWFWLYVVAVCLRL